MLSKFSVKKPYTVIVGIILVIVLGVISFANMTTDLLPNMDLPYVAVYTTYVGAMPEQVESDVTRPMEASFATLSDISGITSTSAENLSIIILEFESGVDMNGVLIELSSQIDMLRGSWSDSVGAPVVMQINPDMLPVSIASVSLEGADVRELTDFVDETLLPKLEGIDGVASVSVSGAVEETVSITIDEDRIELLNSLILREVDEELADVEAQLNSAQAQISEGKRLLAREKSNALGQIDEALSQLSDEALSEPLAQAQAQRETLQTQLAQTEAAIAAMEALTSLTPEQQAQLDALNAQLAGLRTQRETKQAALEALQGAVTDPAAQAQYEEALARREELLEQRASLETYIEEQTLRDPEALRARIDALDAQIAENEASLAALEGEITALNAQADALGAQVAALEEQIAAAEATPAPSAEPSPSATPTVSGTPTVSTTPTTSTTPITSVTPTISATPTASPSPLRRSDAAAVHLLSIPDKGQGWGHDRAAFGRRGGRRGSAGGNAPGAACRSAGRPSRQWRRSLASAKLRVPNRRRLWNWIRRGLPNTAIRSPLWKLQGPARTRRNASPKRSGRSTRSTQNSTNSTRPLPRSKPDNCPTRSAR